MEIRVFSEVAEIAVKDGSYVPFDIEQDVCQATCRLQRSNITEVDEEALSRRVIRRSILSRSVQWARTVQKTKYCPKWETLVTGRSPLQTNRLSRDISGLRRNDGGNLTRIWDETWIASRQLCCETRDDVTEYWSVHKNIDPIDNWQPQLEVWSWCCMVGLI